MKILAIMLAPPLPATAGHRLRNVGLLRALAAEGHRVKMLSFAAAGEMRSPAPELASLCAGYELFAEPAAHQITGRLRTLFFRKPYGALRLTSPPLRARAAELLSRQQFDAILLDDIYLLGSVPETSVPILLNKHDIIHRIVGQFARAQANPLVRLYGLLEAAKIRRWERGVMARSACVLICSERDRELLAEDCAVPMHLAPNVVDMDNYEVCGPGKGSEVLFVGAMEWAPNADAVAFFVEEIFPRLRRLAPEARFIAAGRKPSAALLRRYARTPGVQFTGMVEDLRPVIAQAAVCVVPLRLGSGTRLKILEAAAMGKAVVSTRLGAEGLELRHGHELLLADDPQEFAEAVAGLLQDRARAAKLGKAARAAVEKQYSIRALQAHLRRALATLGHGAPAEMAEAGGRR